jgi:hypothetical protein
VRSKWQTLVLHREAPAKPPPGAPCNGCGVCCAAAPCPAALLIFRSRQGPCPALEWQTQPAPARYRCGLLASPQRRLRWLPAALARRLFARWIAAGRGCDSDAEIGAGADAGITPP